MKCKNCGKELPEGTRFCENCGAKVDEPAAPQQWEGFARPNQEQEEQKMERKADNPLKNVKVSAKLNINTPFGSGVAGLKRTLIVVGVVVLVLVIFRIIGG